MTEDEALRAALQDAAGSPALTRRRELLSSLLARIDAGGADVSDAPLPRAPLRALPTPRFAAPGATSPARKVAGRIAGIGVGGWAAVAIGSAAAATAGVWLIAGSGSDPAVGPATAPIPAPAAVSSASASPTPQATPVAAHAPDLPPLGDPIDAVVDDLVGPVLSDVRLLASSGRSLGALGCDAASLVRVTVTDETGVAAVFLRVTGRTGDIATVPLARGRADTWSGVVTPLVLGGVVKAQIVARDGSGNTSTVPATQIFDGGCPD